MLLLFTLTIFISSTLVFLVQPLFARMVLPYLGGSSGVWNTAMLFYQAVLLLGYGYAHLATRYLGVRRQATLHAAIMLLPFLVLPIAYPAGWVPPSDSNPTGWLLLLFAVAIGLPYLVVTTSSPLIQRWFSVIGHQDSKDPYFLYAASNVGSMLALLGYPLLLEPFTPLATQGWLWTTGYVLLVWLSWTCIIIVRRKTANQVEQEEIVGLQERIPTWPKRLQWVALAFVPSSLVLSVTAYITTDLASAPLLWVVPLALYLVTFIFAFGRRAARTMPFFERAMPMALVALVMVLAMGSTRPIAVMIPLHLIAFYIIARVCHGRVAESRPGPSYLTEFYLWVAVGGVAGGLFNALLAPLMFNSFAEYPIGLVVAALMVFTRDSKSDRKSRLLDIGLPVILGVVTLLLVLLVEQMGLASTPPGLLACFGLPALAAYFLSRRHLRFALALAVILLASAFYGENHDELLATRSFFGLHRVSYDPATNQHQLAHGNTLHGQQSLTPELRSIPLAYYHPTGPVGDVFKLYGNQSTLRVGAVGLGAGALATYARAGQDWTFFEIDPAVASIASNPDYFTYLSNSSVPIKIRLGDARITLTSAPDAGFDILVLDAYSSDSIPVHLATREAIQLYVSKLAPKGIIAFHLSNQHLNLVPVLANLAADANLVCFDRHDQDVSEDEIRQGKAESRWLVMARNQQDLKKLIATGRWRRQKPDPSAPLWTDDYASLIQALE